MAKLRTLSIDFDGVLSSYASGWQGADIINDPPAPGAMEFLDKVIHSNIFRVAIYSARSGQKGGIAAMQAWLVKHMGDYFAATYGEDDRSKATTYVNEHIDWPLVKPSAFLTIDDRAWPFRGAWPQIDDLAGFKTWWEEAALKTEAPKAPPMITIRIAMGNHHRDITIHGARTLINLVSAERAALMVSFEDHLLAVAAAGLFAWETQKAAQDSNIPVAQTASEV